MGYFGSSQGLIPQREPVNFQLLHPECRDKPQINEVSRLLAQGKRSNEPIHERLYKQDLMAKRIAQEIDNEPSNERARSKDSMSLANAKKSRPTSALGASKQSGSRNH